MQIKQLGVKAKKFSTLLLHPLDHLSLATHELKTHDDQKLFEKTQENTLHHIISEDCLDGESNLNNDELVGTDLIDHDIDLDDEKERRENLLQNAMYYALLTLFLPIHMVPERSQVQLTLSQLKSEVLKLFEPNVSRDELEKMWNDLYVNKSKNGSIDLAIDFLLLRRYTLSTDYKLTYVQSDFKSPEKYQFWKHNKIKEIDLILDSIKNGRRLAFSCKLEFEIDEMKLKDSPSLKKKHECDILYHLDSTDPESSIKINNETKTKTVYESKTSQAKGQVDGSFTPKFSDLLKLSLSKKEQDVKFSIILSKLAGLKKKEIGHVTIPVADLIAKLFPDTNWGTISEPTRIEFPIQFENNLQIGIIRLKICKGSYHSFPVHQQNWSTYLDERLKVIKANLNNMETPNIYKLKGVLLRRSFMAPKNELNLVTSVQKWILGEIDLLFGLSTHNAEISLLDVLSRNIRFLISFTEQFSKSYEMATKMVSDNLRQVEKVNEIMERTEAKVLDLLMHFKDRFPRNKPDGALENVVKLYDTITCAHHKKTFEQYLDKLKDVVQKSIENDYELLKRQQLEVFKTEEMSAKVLIAMIPSLVYKLDRLYDYSSTFPDDIKYEKMNWTYYDLFKKDFESIERSGGFSGYQMLHFCAKLKDLSEVIENSADLSEKKSEMIDIVTVSKGYEEKFMAELFTKLRDCADQSIKIDNWLQVNEDVKHSTSVVDFYTAANEVWNYVSGLEFFNEHLLQMFTEMLAQVTLEYANQVKNLAVSVIAKNSKEKKSNVTPNSNLAQKSKSLSLFKHKENTGLEDYIYSEIELSTDFLVMLNDIDVSKQELEEVLSSVTEKHKDLIENAQIAIDLEHCEEQDLDLENEDDLKKSSDNYEIGDRQMSALEKSRTAIDLIIESLIAIISSSFRIPIRATLQKIMDTTKKIIETQQARPLSREATLKLIQSQTDKILSDDLLESVLTPAFTILSENCYDHLFKILLESVLDVINSEMINTFLLPTENYDVELDKEKFLSIEQMFILESVHSAMGIYLCGNDDDPDTGLSESILERKSRLLVKLFSLYQSSTSKLIGIFEKYIKYPNLNFSNVLKKHHIILLIKAKGDKESVAFYKIHHKEAEKQRIIQVFNLKPVEGDGDDDESNDKYEELLVSVGGTYEMSPYDIHVTELRLLLESKCSRKTKEFLLKNITNAKLSKHLLSTKGVQFSISGDERIYVISFNDSEIRTKFLNVFSQQLKNIGNEQSQLLELKSPTTSSSSSKKLDSTIFDQAADGLKSKFKIKNSNCKLLKRIIAQATYKTTENNKIFISGEILLFNYGICFHCGSDGVKGAFSLKFNFSTVESIEKKKRKDESMRIKIQLMGGYTVSFYNVEFLESSLNEITQAFEQWKKDSATETSLIVKYKKNGEDKNYFINRFNLRNIGESDECLDRKFIVGASLTVSGILYIGNYHICYESNDFLPNNGEEKKLEVIVTPVALIDKIEKYVHSKILAIRLLSGHMICYMFEDEKSLEAAYQRINVKVQSLTKPKISIFGSSNNESNLYISSILKPLPIDLDSPDQRILNSAIITKQIQEAPLQQTVGALGIGLKNASGNSGNGGSGKISAYFSNIGKTIFGSKKK